MLEVGAKAPDFTLPQVGGGRVSLLEELGRCSGVLLVFLRYLG